MLEKDRFAYDQAWTESNRQKLLGNRNLLFWYRKLYARQFAGIPDLTEKTILEIGSGASPLKRFYPQVITSDILPLDYLDHAFDCLRLSEYPAIKDESVDIISLTNVLHHLRDPLAFLRQAHCKLKPQGRIILTEPYFSALSLIIFKLFHHEPSRFKIDRPVLSDVRGPLSSANMAIPYLLFFSSRGWDRELREFYTFDVSQVVHFSALSYMATGGISRKFPVPAFCYQKLLPCDLWLADKFPSLFSSFFCLTLFKRQLKSEEA